MTKRNVLKVGTVEIDYELVYRKRKSVGISVTHQGIKVAAPFYISKEKVSEVVQEKASWIIEKLNLLRDEQSNEKKYEDGEKFLYLGTEYPITLIKTVGLKKAGVDFSEKGFIIKLPDHLDVTEEKYQVKEALIQWYVERFKLILDERINFYAAKMNLRPARVTVKNQKSRWGSCSSKRNINMNWRIIMAPASVIDYIIVHELAHLKHMDHSRSFWQVVESVMPDFKLRQNWLKRNEIRLRI